MSAKYAAMEDQFINIATKDKEFTYKLTGAEKVCMDSFMASRNGKALFSKGSVDVNGKSTLVDEVGRPLIATEGLIPQAERFASKFVFNESTFGMRLFERALSELVAKCDDAMGNTFTFVVNTRLWNLVQRRMSSWVRDWKTTGAFVWSQAANKYVDLGATYQSYEFGGNKVVFCLDRSLDIEFPKKAYGIFLDMGTDSNGHPGIMNFTFKGGDLIHNVIKGVEYSSCAA